MAWRRVRPDGGRRNRRSIIGQSIVFESARQLKADETIITYYGYCDGSGEFYVVIDADKCNGCEKCVATCPQKALLIENQMIDLEDKNVAAVSEGHRKRIKYTCQPCKPEAGKTPCVLACSREAIKCVWNPR